MCDEESKTTLENILNVLLNQDYEPGGIFTIGGGAGTYILKSPWNTECEFQVTSVTTSQATGVGYAVSGSNPTIAAPVKNTTAYGALVNGGEGNALDGVAGFISAGAPASFTQWIPLGRGAYIYFSAGVAGGDSMLCSLSFRRSTRKFIPMVPQELPHTHNYVLSRRPIRMIDSLSKQLSGFEAQYPELSGVPRKPYEHEEIPYTQDTDPIINTTGDYYAKRRMQRKRG
jgi:hypothetical protein